MYLSCEHPPKTKDSREDIDGVEMREIMRRETKTVIVSDMFDEFLREKD